MRITLAGLLALTMAASTSALPQDLQRQQMADFKEQCGNNELSCCSNLKSTASASIGPNSFNPISVVVDTVNNMVPVTSILSGCAPLIGTELIFLLICKLL